MRLSPLLILLFIPLQGFTCDDSTFSGVAPAGNVYNCPAGLILSSTGIQKAGIPNSDPLNPILGPEPLVINVTGDAIINADIIVDGNHGITIFGDNISSPLPGDSPGAGSGGPGAFGGGGVNTGSAEPGNGFSPNDGSGGEVELTLNCGAGGGGAGNKTNGQAGGTCFDGVAGTEIGVPGSAIASIPLPGSFAGGFGGGGGGPKVVSSPNFDNGMGGGGGGGLLINATGKIIIGNGVRISARGGNGGKAAYNGGGGGGGSGGNIYFISPLPIENKGIIDVRGGRGGGTRSASPRGGKGGDGGDGFIRFEVNGIPEDIPNAYLDASSGGSANKLKSDISCGTIAAKKSENQNLLFQMMIGFGLVALALRIRIIFS